MNRILLSRPQAPTAAVALLLHENIITAPMTLFEVLLVVVLEYVRTFTR